MNKETEVKSRFRKPSKVAHAKAHKPWEAEYMQLHEMISLAEQDARTIGYKDGYEEDHAEGHAEGRNQARLDDIDKLVASGVADVAKACEILGVSLSDYESYKTGNLSL